jgi:hypothetical protein
MQQPLVIAAATASSGAGRTAAAGDESSSSYSNSSQTEAVPKERLQRQEKLMESIITALQTLALKVDERRSSNGRRAARAPPADADDSILFGAWIDEQQRRLAAEVKASNKRLRDTQSTVKRLEKEKQSLNRATDVETDKRRTAELLNRLQRVMEALQTARAAALLHKAQSNDLQLQTQDLVQLSIKGLEALPAERRPAFAAYAAAARECLDSIADRYRRRNAALMPHGAIPQCPVGSFVYVRQLDSRKVIKGQPAWAGPYVVVRQPSVNQYELAPPNDLDATFLIWAGHVRPADDVNNREITDAEKAWLAADADNSPYQSAPPLSDLPYDPDDFDHDG